MRLKDIKFGMVIHCKTKEEYQALMEELESKGYTWGKGTTTAAEFVKGHENVHEITIAINEGYFSIGNGSRKMIEFFDLIIPELTAEDGNFKSQLQRATGNQIRIAINYMEQGEGKHKSRIAACKRELRRRDRCG